MSDCADPTERCSVHVRTKGLRFQSHQCRNKAVASVDGRYYCRVHDPKFREQKLAARSAKFNEKMAKQRAAWEALALVKRIADGEFSGYSELTVLIRHARRITKRGG